MLCVCRTCLSVPLTVVLTTVRLSVATNDIHLVMSGSATGSGFHLTHARMCHGLLCNIAMSVRLYTYIHATSLRSYFYLFVRSSYLYHRHDQQLGGRCLAEHDTERYQDAGGGEIGSQQTVGKTIYMYK